MALGLGFASRRDWLRRLTAEEYKELRIFAQYERFGLDRTDAYAAATGLDVTQLVFEPQEDDGEDQIMNVMDRVSESCFNGRQAIEQTLGDVNQQGS